MEPGGDDAHASYESWLDLGGRELIDCRAHHEDSNRRAGRQLTRWHDARPRLQRTWSALIRLVLAFENRRSDRAAVAAYQRDRWGREDGDTAVIQISALHAPNLRKPVERTSHRAERLQRIAQRLETHRPLFVVFYGVSYRRPYEAIAGAFSAESWRWHGSTLCVLTHHPTARGLSTAHRWEDLGSWMRQMIGSNSSARLIDPDPSSIPDERPSGTSLDRDGRQQGATEVHESDPFEPMDTVSALARLVTDYGFGDAQFRQLHHFAGRASVRIHTDYCQKTKRFSDGNNVIVARRLFSLLRHLEAGEQMAPAIRRVRAEFPMGGS